MSFPKDKVVGAMQCGATPIPRVHTTVYYSSMYLNIIRNGPTRCGSPIGYPNTEQLTILDETVLQV